MSEKKPDADPAAAPEQAESTKKGLPIKLIAVVGGVMALEAGGIIALMNLASPPAIHADPGQINLHDDLADQTSEIEIVNDKFQNMQTGRTWIVGVGIYVQVKNRNVVPVKKILEAKRNEVVEGINQIISRSQLNQLKEPTRQTLNRQITDYLATLLVGEEGTVEAMLAAQSTAAGGGEHGGEAKAEGHVAESGHEPAAGSETDSKEGAPKVRLFERVLIPKCEMYSVDI